MSVADDDFHNTLVVETWPAPEVPESVNTDDLGNLGLTAEEEAASVAFMKGMVGLFGVPHGLIVPMPGQRTWR